MLPFSQTKAEHVRCKGLLRLTGPLGDRQSASENIIGEVSSTRKRPDDPCESSPEDVPFWIQHEKKGDVSGKKSFCRFAFITRVYLTCMMHDAPSKKPQTVGS